MDLNKTKEKVIKVISDSVRCIKNVNVDFVNNDKVYLLISFSPDFTSEHLIKKQDDVVDSWKDIYEFEYNNVKLENNDFDTDIWKSTFTRENISKELMREWVANTVSRIRSLQPNIVLEIGCGVGLLLLQIVDYVKKYIATDFSSTIIEKLNTYKNACNIQNLELYVSSARDFRSISELCDVDTVIMNSVIQYFPSAKYLSGVICELSDYIKNGQIFVGDIRDYSLLQQFYYDVNKSKHPNLSYDELLSRSQIDARREGELFVSSDFFIDLYKQNKNITGIEILPKRGSVELEMNCYRYDVILYVGDNHNENIIDSSTIYFKELNKDVFKNVAFHELPENFVIKNYPDIRKCKNDQSIAELLTIENIESIAHKYDYNFYFCYSVDAKFRSHYMDLFFYRKDNIKFHNLYCNAETDNCCYNIPLEQQIFNTCIQHIKNELKKHLSEAELNACKYVMQNSMSNFKRRN